MQHFTIVFVNCIQRVQYLAPTLTDSLGKGAVSVMSMWSSIIDILLFLSRYSINSKMIKFIHNQGHIKIVIINEPQYDPP